jgi:hypothetical protein
MNMGRHTASAALGGLLAGLLGAATMIVFSTVAAALAHGHFWYEPLELAGSIPTGSLARFQSGIQLDSVIIGLFVHFAVGAAWGAIFGVGVAYVAYHLLPNEGLWYGAAFGILVWATDLFLVLPRVDTAAAHAIPMWVGAVSHLCYGAVVGYFFHFFRPHHDEELRHRAEFDREHPSPSD